MQLSKLGTMELREIQVLFLWRGASGDGRFGSGEERDGGVTGGGWRRAWPGVLRLPAPVAGSNTAAFGSDPLSPGAVIPAALVLCFPEGRLPASTV